MEQKLDRYLLYLPLYSYIQSYLAQVTTSSNIPFFKKLKKIGKSLSIVNF